MGVSVFMKVFVGCSHILNKISLCSKFSFNISVNISNSINALYPVLTKFSLSQIQQDKFLNPESNGH